MLEHAALLVRAWTTSADGGVRHRAICDAETDAQLGHAAGKRGGPIRFLGGDTIKVFESEDASLLMTLLKPWAFARTWQVWDADDRRVGLLYRDQIWDSKGQPLARMQGRGSSGPSRFVIGDRELAAFESRGPDQTLLNFSEFVRGDPFAKMAILGRVLLLD